MSEYQLPAYLIVIFVGVATILIGCICGGASLNDPMKCKHAEN